MPNAKGTRPTSSRSQSSPPPPPPPLLRVFCHGIDDVRLYRALSEAGALGRVVVAASVAEADAVLAVRIKRTGRAVSMDLVTRSARKAGKPLLELPAISAVRVSEALEVLTGWPVPPHLRRSPHAPGGVAYLPALQPGTDGAAEALALLSGGLTSLAEYLAQRAGEGAGGAAGAAAARAAQPAPELLAELDGADVYDSREAERPANPQVWESSRQPELTRPHMPGSRQERIRLRLELQRRAAEEAGLVDW
ncbi:hypothetical protein HXX76_002725 [Chlamydomonas incerta]|uniref:Uncharacterized protein n=1 Tax=Chlamydomonas incerta TaxID=51695 RepID=A0A835TP62_CHLIN|nr:hypothetical protein HXX76_002725 [Chlamydomonas incerta]|eukprot:KAG2442641.1 hypothetical protein HXX76_002725 [Chlamydomonas incerta]